MLLVCSFFASSAQAFELFGIRFFESQSDQGAPSPDAQRYEIEFQVAGGDEDQRERLQAASQLYSERENPPPSSAALVARGRGDYSRLLAALYAEGRYGGTIAITVAGQPVEAVPVDAVLPDPVPIRVTVDPGPLFTFGELRIAGRPGPIPDDNDVPPTPEELGLVPGAPAKSTIVLQSETALINSWRELGHPTAKIARRQTVARHATNQLDVTIIVEPRPRAVYGELRVTGTDRMDPAFVARQTGLEPGETFDPDDIELGKEQLRRLDVFQSVQFVEAEQVGPDGTLPMTIQVTERPLRIFGISLTHSTLEGAGVGGYWQHRNLFGQAERLRVEGRVARIGENSVEDYDYFVGATIVKPGVFTPFTDLTVRVFAEQERPETYLARRTAAKTSLSHRFSDTVSGSAGVSFEASRIEDPLGTRNFLLASLPGEIVYDSRDDELNPTEGVRLMFRAEPFHEFERQNTAIITEAGASAYFALDDESRFILAGRARVGSIAGAGRDEIPANRLFFAGGGGSIRGYGYKNVGPRLPSGEVVGGRSYVDGSLELRTQITDQIGFVPFVDFGNAFVSSFPDFSQDLRVGAGAGIRYFTGIGPIRVDVAVPLNPRPGDPDFAIYMGLGQSY